MTAKLAAGALISDVTEQGQPEKETNSVTTGGN